MGAGEREIFADEMHQQRARLDEAFDLGSVHCHGHMGLCHFGSPLKSMILKSGSRFSEKIMLN
jgi:hypothetical protein